MQHDVQEFSRILQDKLEIKMKVSCDPAIASALSYIPGHAGGRSHSQTVQGIHEELHQVH